MMLLCPHCQTALVLAEKNYYCSNNHCFDIGKAGDVNLLLPQQKRSKHPGDSKAMVAARRDFLNSGVYQPIAEMLAKQIIVLSQGGPAVIADAGCGEGYYLRQIQRLCYPSLDYFYRSGGAFIGWDISKYAVQSAAKQADFAAKWVTASNAGIPLADNSVDVLLSNFAFEVADEFARVVKAGGYIITLDAGQAHLIELRQLIYPTIKAYQAKPTLTRLTLIKKNDLHYQLTLSAQQLAQLMLMTPHFYRTTKQAKERLGKLTELRVTVSVNLHLYQAR
ncbi:MAG: rRNA (guanine-N1)-methyltransferase [Gammaproteobacteria bacterium]|nr:MAG: rRNA (guanine-N1)-methyltransferase [Gammaproteobacteria bacterium]